MYNTSPGFNRNNSYVARVCPYRISTRACVFKTENLTNRVPQRIKLHRETCLSGRQVWTVMITLLLFRYLKEIAKHS